MQQLEFWFHKNDLILNTIKTCNIVSFSPTSTSL